MPEQMMLSQGVPSRSNGVCICPQCQRPFKPYKRCTDQIWCSSECRTRHWKIEHDVLKAPVQNPDKMTRAENVLARLRKGSCTGLELLKAGGGTCYRDQVCALRRMGHNILGSRPWKRPDGSAGGQVPQTDEGWDQYRLASEGEGE